MVADGLRRRRTPRTRTGQGLPTMGWAGRLRVGAGPVRPAPVLGQRSSRGPALARPVRPAGSARGRRHHSLGADQTRATPEPIRAAAGSRVRPRLGRRRATALQLAVRGVPLGASGLLPDRGPAAHPRMASRRALVSATIALPLAGTAIPLDTTAQSGTLRLGAVQGNVPDDNTQTPSRSRAILDNHVAGTLALLDQVAPGDLDVVLWPENATDIDPRADDDARGVVDEAAQALDAPILVGTDRYTDAGRYNDMLLWEPGAGPTLSYSKQRPAPFGEYIPWRPFVRLFSAEVDRVSIDMIPGQEPAIVPIPTPRLNRDVPVATIICFEVAYDALIREAVLQGAELIVVPTNNASFGLTAESTQQLAMSRLRAVEHGRATIQISTVGVSAIIAPDGTIQQQTQLFTSDQVLSELPLRTALTPADRLGDWPTITAVIFTSMGMLGGLAENRRRARHADIHRDASLIEVQAPLGAISADDGAP